MGSLLLWQLQCAHACVHGRARARVRPLPAGLGIEPGCFAASQNYTWTCEGRIIQLSAVIPSTTRLPKLAREILFLQRLADVSETCQVVRYYGASRGLGPSLTYEDTSLCAQ